ncbi:MAG: branched-chain amino acid ABC transporter permease, partial [Acetobacteraceae bacterium]|nr:branched-chain amino acid ABC transporter permease [Acetobacteraceae bacterium]
MDRRRHLFAAGPSLGVPPGRPVRPGCARSFVTRRAFNNLLPPLLLAAALAFPLLYDDDAAIDAAADAAVFAILALGLNVVLGYAGLLDLGYAAFFAIGAYAYGIFTSYQVQPHWSGFWQPFAAVGLVARTPNDFVHFTLSFWLALPLSALLASGCGVVFGAPTLRLKGDYLAIVTLGFGEIVPIVARNLPSVTNGAAGLNGVAPPSLFGHSFGIAATPYYEVAVVLVAALMLVSVRLRGSRIGRAWMAIREDETAAAAMGVDRVRLKLLAFAIGAAFAGMAGTVYVAKLQTATPEMFGFPVSVMVLVMIVLGGLGSEWGAVLGAVMLSLLQSWFLPGLTEWLHALGDAIGSAWLRQIELAPATELIFGIVLVLTMLFRREGLLPAARKQPALSFEQQHIEMRQVEPGLARPADPRPASVPALEVADLTVRFGGL